VEDGAGKIFQSLLDLGYVTVEELKIITGKKMKAQPPTKQQVARPTTKTPVVATKAGASNGKGAKARPAARAARVGKPAAKVETKKAAPKRSSKAR
jgi:adenylylsulfate kinase